MNCDFRIARTPAMTHAAGSSKSVLKYKVLSQFIMFLQRTALFGGCSAHSNCPLPAHRFFFFKPLKPDYPHWVTDSRSSVWATGSLDPELPQTARDWSLPEFAQSLVVGYMPEVMFAKTARGALFYAPLLVTHPVLNF
jgi:hypothetical protein